jgi:hypothetical protein
MADNRCKFIFYLINKFSFWKKNILLVSSRTFVNSNSTRNNTNTNNFRFDNNHNERNYSQEYIPNTNEDWDVEIDENKTKQWWNIC